MSRYTVGFYTFEVVYPVIFHKGNTFVKIKYHHQESSPAIYQDSVLQRLLVGGIPWCFKEPLIVGYFVMHIKDSIKGLQSNWLNGQLQIESFILKCIGFFQ